MGITAIDNAASAAQQFLKPDAELPATEKSPVMLPPVNSKWSFDQYLSRVKNFVPRDAFQAASELRECAELQKLRDANRAKYAWGTFGGMLVGLLAWPVAAGFNKEHSSSFLKGFAFVLSGGVVGAVATRFFGRLNNLFEYEYQCIQMPENRLLFAAKRMYDSAQPAEGDEVEKRIALQPAMQPAAYAVGAEKMIKSSPSKWEHLVDVVAGMTLFALIAKFAPSLAVGASPASFGASTKVSFDPSGNDML